MILRWNLGEVLCFGLLFVKEGFFSLFPSYEQEMINKTCFVFSSFKASWHGKKCCCLNRLTLQSKPITGNWLQLKSNPSFGTETTGFRKRPFLAV